MSKPTDPNKKPQGELAIRTIARPADTNINGDIFGGWLMSQIDIAAAMSVYTLSSCGCETDAVKE